MTKVRHRDLTIVRLASLPSTLVVASLFHAIAIGSGIFRSTYRWYISRFGWEDVWALLALLTDVGCLICSWLEQSVPRVSFLSFLIPIINFPTDNQ